MAASKTERFIATARWVGAEPDTIDRALACSVPALVVSGRLASGKDTVAEAVMLRLGHPDAVRVSFADPLREEVDQVIDTMRANVGRDPVEMIVSTSNVLPPVAVEVMQLVNDALSGDPLVTSRRRTPEIRRLLQFWGTEVRRSVDQDYWVKRSLRRVVELMASGVPVYVTDARFVNELTAARDLGMYAVRLEVDFPIRAHRLMLRDGLEIDPVAERHPSEAELDGFDGFDLRVDNSGPLDVTVGAVVAVWPVSSGAVSGVAG